MYTGCEDKAMNQDDFERITKDFKTTQGDGKLAVLPEGAQLTFYVAHGGASLSVAKVDAYRLDAGLLVLRTTKKETFHLRLDDVFAISAEGAAGGASARKPVGFGL